MVPSDVTIAILSCVEPPLPECLRAVEAQLGGPYRVIRVKDVFPMSTCFLAMVDECNSRMIVQVDSDIILKPWAVKVLSDRGRSAWWAYAVWGQLWQENWGFGGSVRCWIRPFVKWFGFRDVRCIDRDLHQRARRICLRRIQAFGPEESFGTHAPCRTDFSLFSKARNDVIKWRYLGRHDLIERSRLGVLDRWSQAGIESGMKSTWAEVRRSKDAFEDWRLFQNLGN